jgi:ATP-dependent DNA helicase RecQ
LPRLPIDWRTLDRRRRNDERKLREMQGYVYTEECRRGYVLRYFGERVVDSDCGACDVCLGEVPEVETATPRRRGRATATPVAAPSATDSTRATGASADPALLDRLKRVRSELASRESLPAYCIFNDATLDSIAARSPLTESDLLDVKGVGPTKLAKYGQMFLDVVRRHRNLS